MLTDCLSQKVVQWIRNQLSSAMLATTAEVRSGNEIFNFSDNFLTTAKTKQMISNGWDILIICWRAIYADALLKLCF